MTDILRLIRGAIADFFRLRVDREAEILTWRHPVNLLRRRRLERLALSSTDRPPFV
jgi:hypothetical protein